jgi:hypothetical protein
MDAFAEIGATQTVQVLTEVRNIMARHGVTLADLRAGLTGAKAFQITSLEKAHGKDLSAMLDEIERAGDDLYLYLEDGEDVDLLLTEFVEKNRAELLNILREA